jgi:hypothetical protein
MRKPDAYLCKTSKSTDPYWQEKVCIENPWATEEQSGIRPLYLQDNESDLVELVKRLARQHLSRNEAASELDIEAIDHLKRKGLIGSVLRKAEVNNE